MEFIKFIFSSFWVFMGFWILLGILCRFICVIYHITLEYWNIKKHGYSKSFMYNNLKKLIKEMDDE